MRSDFLQLQGYDADNWEGNDRCPGRSAGNLCITLQLGLCIYVA
jgi:hypothetical protein